MIRKVSTVDPTWCIIFRILEFMTCVICMGFSLYILFATNVILWIKVTFVVASVMFSFITLFDIIGYGNKSPINCLTTWILFAICGMLFFFIAAAFLLYQSINYVSAIAILATIFAAVTGLIFLIDFLYIIERRIRKDNKRPILWSSQRVVPLGCDSKSTQTIQTETFATKLSQSCHGARSPKPKLKEVVIIEEPIIICSASDTIRQSVEEARIDYVAIEKEDKKKKICPKCHDPHPYIKKSDSKEVVIIEEPIEIHSAPDTIRQSVEEARIDYVAIEKEDKKKKICPKCHDPHPYIKKSDSKDVVIIEEPIEIHSAPDTIRQSVEEARIDYVAIEKEHKKKKICPKCHDPHPYLKKSDSKDVVILEEPIEIHSAPASTTRDQNEEERANYVILDSPGHIAPEPLPEILEKPGPYTPIYRSIAPEKILCRLVECQPVKYEDAKYEDTSTIEHRDGITNIPTVQPIKDEQQGLTIFDYNTTEVDNTFVLDKPRDPEDILKQFKEERAAAEPLKYENQTETKSVPELKEEPVLNAPDIYTSRKDNDISSSKSNSDRKSEAEDNYYDKHKCRIECQFKEPENLTKPQKTEDQNDSFSDFDQALYESEVISKDQQSPIEENKLKEPEIITEEITTPNTSRKNESSDPEYLIDSESEKANSDSPKIYDCRKEECPMEECDLKKLEPMPVIISNLEPPKLLELNSQVNEEFPRTNESSDPENLIDSDTSEIHHYRVERPMEESVLKKIDHKKPEDSLSSKSKYSDTKIPVLNTEACTNSLCLDDQSSPKKLDQMTQCPSKHLIELFEPLVQNIDKDNSNLHHVFGNSGEQIKSFCHRIQYKSENNVATACLHISPCKDECVNVEQIELDTKSSSNKSSGRCSGMSKSDQRNTEEYPVEECEAKKRKVKDEYQSIIAAYQQNKNQNTKLSELQIIEPETNTNYDEKLENCDIEDCEMDECLLYIDNTKSIMNLSLNNLFQPSEETVNLTFQEEQQSTKSTSRTKVSSRSIKSSARSPITPTNSYNSNLQKYIDEYEKVFKITKETITKNKEGSSIEKDHHSAQNLAAQKFEKGAIDKHSLKCTKSTGTICSRSNRSVPDEYLIKSTRSSAKSSNSSDRSIGFTLNLTEAELKEAEGIPMRRSCAHMAIPVLMKSTPETYYELPGEIQSDISSTKSPVLSANSQKSYITSNRSQTCSSRYSEKYKSDKNELDELENTERSIKSASLSQKSYIISNRSQSCSSRCSEEYKSNKNEFDELEKTERSIKSDSVNTKSTSEHMKKCDSTSEVEDAIPSTNSAATSQRSSKYSEEPEKYLTIPSIDDEIPESKAEILTVDEITTKSQKSPQRSPKKKMLMKSNRPSTKRTSTYVSSYSSRLPCQEQCQKSAREDETEEELPTSPLTERSNRLYQFMLEKHGPPFPTILQLEETQISPTACSEPTAMNKYNCCSPEESPRKYTPRITKADCSKPIMKCYTHLQVIEEVSNENIPSSVSSPKSSEKSESTAPSIKSSAASYDYLTFCKLHSPDRTNRNFEIDESIHDADGIDIESTSYQNKTERYVVPPISVADVSDLDSYMDSQQNSSRVQSSTQQLPSNRPETYVELEKKCVCTDTSRVEGSICVNCKKMGYKITSPFGALEIRRSSAPPKYKSINREPVKRNGLDTNQTFRLGLSPVVKQPSNNPPAPTAGFSIATTEYRTQYKKPPILKCPASRYAQNLSPPPRVKKSAAQQKPATNYGSNSESGTERKKNQSTPSTYRTEWSPISQNKPSTSRR